MRYNDGEKLQLKNVEQTKQLMQDHQNSWDAKINLESHRRAKRNYNINNSRKWHAGESLILR